jgi:two-component system chemotaxis response regulator CheB
MKAAARGAGHRVVVIGASVGGVPALKTLAAQLPADFPAPILVVLHIGSHPSILPELLAKRGPLPARHARDGETLVRGRIYVAPPDQHLLLDGETVRLSRGPKEQHWRPAIDPLFRTAALSRGRDVIGVVLTGKLDDGTVGLQAVKACGGVAVVQDPGDAEEPSMPASALRHVDVDFRAPLAEIASLLTRLASAPPVDRTLAAAPAVFVHEQALADATGDPLNEIDAIGVPSTFTCPECHGSLWNVTGAKPTRFRCHTGHAFTIRALSEAQAEAADGALWSGLRALQEKEMLLRAMAQEARDDHRPSEAGSLEAVAAGLVELAGNMREAIGIMPSSTDPG